MNKPWYKKWWGITILIILTLILIFIIAFSFYVADLTKKIKSGELPQYDLIDQKLDLDQAALAEIEGSKKIRF